MKQTLQLKLSQHLTLTPQLQQSIRLLQLSTLELNQELEKFLAENPLLEREDTDAPGPIAPTQMNGESAATLEPSAERSETESPAQTDTDIYSAELDWVGQSGSNSGARDDSEENDYSKSRPILPVSESICTSSSPSRSCKRGTGTWWCF